MLAAACGGCVRYTRLTEGETAHLCTLVCHPSCLASSLAWALQAAGAISVLPYQSRPLATSQGLEGLPAFELLVKNTYDLGERFILSHPDDL